MPPDPTATASPSPAPSPTPTPTPEPLRVRARWDPAQVGQGETAMVWVEASRPAEFQAIFDGVDLSVVPIDARRAWGLLPVPAWNPVGDRPLVVTATAADTGETRQDVVRVPVTETDFPVEHLTLPPDRVPLLDPELIRAEWERIRPVFEEVTPRQLWDGAFTWPITGTLTTDFGTRRQYQDGRMGGQHAGLDIAAPTGTPVYAPAAGRVVFSDDVRVRGKLIIVDHGLGLHSAYMHLSQRDVAVGDWVVAGQKLGEVGSTGLSTGPHLHWEMRVYVVAVNPRQWTRYPWSRGTPPP
ncbi:MAG: M23 family metallopeptidase [Ardenticatenia bacterium]|nr:M23 family metallopeptidase [Ardenticatenia bacterium]